jgi:hypothetical protein
MPTTLKELIGISPVLRFQNQFSHYPCFGREADPRDRKVVRLDVKELIGLRGAIASSLHPREKVK